MRCFKGGRIKVLSGEKRKRPSKMTEYPFRLIAQKEREKWLFKLNYDDDNYGPLDFTAHSAHQRVVIYDTHPSLVSKLECRIHRAVNRNFSNTVYCKFFLTSPTSADFSSYFFTSTIFKE